MRPSLAICSAVLAATLLGGGAAAAEASGPEAALAAVGKAAERLATSLDATKLGADAANDDGKVRARVVAVNLTDGHLDAEAVVRVLREKLGSRLALFAEGETPDAKPAYVLECRVSNVRLGGAGAKTEWATAELLLAHFVRSEVDRATTGNALEVNGKLAAPGSPDAATAEASLAEMFGLGPSEVESVARAIGKKVATSVGGHVLVSVQTMAAEPDLPWNGTPLAAALEQEATATGRVRVLPDSRLAHDMLAVPLAGEPPAEPREGYLRAAFSGEKSSRRLEVTLAAKGRELFHGTFPVEPGATAPATAPAEPAPAHAVPEIDALVASEPAGGTVTLSVGRDDHVEPGVTFRVTRGSAEVGRLVVVSVERDAAVARIVVTEPGEKIQLADAVHALPARATAAVLDALTDGAAAQLAGALGKGPARRPVSLAESFTNRSRLAFDDAGAFERVTKALGKSGVAPAKEKARVRIEGRIDRIGAGSGATVLVLGLWAVRDDGFAIAAGTASGLVGEDGAATDPAHEADLTWPRPCPSGIAALAKALDASFTSLVLDEAARAKLPDRRLRARVVAPGELDLDGPQLLGVVGAALTRTGKIACAFEDAAKTCELEARVSVADGTATVELLAGEKVLAKASAPVAKKP